MNIKYLVIELNNSGIIGVTTFKSKDPAKAHFNNLIHQYGIKPYEGTYEGQIVVYGEDIKISFWNLELAEEETKVMEEIQDAQEKFVE
jgi:hypothetical protein